MNPIETSFAPMLGQPSWLVRQGHGSFVTIEFGDPELAIGETRSRTVRLPERGPLTLTTRSAAVHGAWHLWIYCCLWSMQANEVELAHSESDDVTIARALRFLEGQALSEVQVDRESGATKFDFDLGCALATRPAPPGTYTNDPVDQWMLYQPSGIVLIVRSDGHYSEVPRDQPDGATIWHQLPR